MGLISRNVPLHNMEFQFWNPTRIVFGNGKVRDLADDLDLDWNFDGKERALVVTDAGVKAAGVLDYLLESLEGSSRRVVAVFDGVLPEADREQIQEIAGLAEEVQPDFWIALGGGSVMDACKMAAVLESNDGDVEDYEGFYMVDCEAKPIVCIPTTAGTGSEVTWGAVIMDHQAQRKIICGDPIWDRYSYSGAIPSLATEASAYMAQYGATPEDAARVAVRERTHAQNNPYAHMYGRPICLQDVMDSPVLAWPIRLLDICPRTDGACAVIFAAEGLAEQLAPRPAWVQACSVRHTHTWFGDVDQRTGLESLQRASQEAYALAGITHPADDFDVAELYLPYSYAGLKWIEALGFCGPGEGPRFVWDGHTDMGGKIPVNPSGGVMSTNCIGATALLRVAEAAIQVMGRGEARQVSGVNRALATGFGGCWWSDVIILGMEKPQ